MIQLNPLAARIARSIGAQSVSKPIHPALLSHPRRHRCSRKPDHSPAATSPGIPCSRLTALALIEGLWSSRLLGAQVQPLLDDWFKEVNTISKDVHDHKTKDVEFQKALEKLYSRVDLEALLKSLDFDRLAAGVNFPAKGAKSFSGDDAARERIAPATRSSADSSSP